MAKLYQSINKFIVNDLNLSNVHLQELALGEVLEVNIEVLDKRKISDSQRGLIFALCKDVENYTGTESEIVRYSIMEHCNVQTLTNCSVIKANQLIAELIDFMLINQIPMSMKSRNHESFNFEYRHMYMLVLSRTCCITGKRAQIHHVDHVATRGKRDKISHIGMRVLPLSREMHTEAHAIGEKRFLEKYHLTPVIVDERIEKFIKTGKIILYEED